MDISPRPQSIFSFEVGRAVLVAGTGRKRRAEHHLCFCRRRRRPRCWLSDRLRAEGGPPFCLWRVPQTPLPLSGRPWGAKAEAEDGLLPTASSQGAQPTWAPAVPNARAAGHALPAVRARCADPPTCELIPSEHLLHRLNLWPNGFGVHG